MVANYQPNMHSLWSGPKEPASHGRTTSRMQSWKENMCEEKPYVPCAITKQEFLFKCTQVGCLENGYVMQIIGKKIVQHTVHSKHPTALQVRHLHRLRVSHDQHPRSFMCKPKRCFRFTTHMLWSSPPCYSYVCCFSDAYRQDNCWRRITWNIIEGLLAIQQCTSTRCAPP